MTSASLLPTQYIFGHQQCRHMERRKGVCLLAGHPCVLDITIQQCLCNTRRPLRKPATMCQAQAGWVISASINPLESDSHDDIDKHAHHSTCTDQSGAAWSGCTVVLRGPLHWTIAWHSDNQSMHCHVNQSDCLEHTNPWFPSVPTWL